MKKICYAFAIAVMTVILTCPVDGNAQSKDQASTRRSLSNSTMKSRLQSDIHTRKSDVDANSVEWWDSGTGDYYGTYTMDNNEYMARYDKKGNYVGTYTKETWDDQVPANIRSGFDKSPYAGQEVDSYWIASDPGQTGSYLELKDKSGKNTSVWVDSNGQFSTIPPSNAPVSPTPVTPPK